MLLEGDTTLLPDAVALARLHAAEVPQKDELCGAFSTLLALRAAGVDVADQDAVADAAGTVLAPAEADHAASLPVGETGRRDYRLALPTIEDEARSGTSAGGLVRAVGELSGGTHAAIGVTGPFTAETVEGLLGVVAAEEQASLVLNVGTRFFWGSHPTAAELLGYLESGDDSAGPPPEWDVGHFVGCLGSIRGPRGRLVIISDTYPSLGLRGVYLQPVGRVAAALRREGMTAGGVLVVVPAGRREVVEHALRAAGLELGTWDNGSPDARTDGL